MHQDNKKTYILVSNISSMKIKLNKKKSKYLQLTNDTAELPKKIMAQLTSRFFFQFQL